MKVGDTVIVHLGKHRSHNYKGGCLPKSMLKDGTVTTISNLPKDPSRWVTIKGYGFVYPRECLLPYNKIRLLNAIKDFR